MAHQNPGITIKEKTCEQNDLIQSAFRLPTSSDLGIITLAPLSLP